MAAGRRHPHRRHVGRVSPMPSAPAERPTPSWWPAGSTTASHPTVRGARLRAARCARIRSDLLRTQERLARPGPARRRRVLSKAIADAHTTALSEAMEYLTAHAGYTRIHNPRTGEKDLVRLPGLAAIAYQHETSRCGDPHLHTHVIVPNRQARADGATGVDRRDVAVSRSPRGRGDLSSHPAPRTAPVPGPGMGAGRSRRPGWPSWPASTATPSPPGRGAPPSSANGPPTTCTSSTTR